MHLVMAFHTLEMGGIQTLMVRMASWMHSRGHEMTCVFTHGDHSLPQMLPKGARIVVDPALVMAVCRGSPDAARRFRESHLSGRHVDAFLACSDFDLWLCAGLLNGQEQPARLLAGVFGNHNFAIGRVGRRRPRISRILYPGGHLFLHELDPRCRLYMNRAIIEYVDRDLGESAPGRIWPLPVEGRGFLAIPRSPDRRSIVSVGRLVPMKSYSLWMIDVIDELRRRGRDVRWTVYGDGPLRDKMDRRIDALGLHDRIRIAGEVPYERLGEVLSSAGAFVGMGTAIVEAAFAGVPGIVAPADEPGPESFGLLTDLPDYCFGENIALPKVPAVRVIEELLDLDERGYDDLCTAHRRHAQRFELDSVMDRFLELVEEAPLSAKVAHDGWRFTASTIWLKSRSWRNSLQTVRGPKSDEPRSPGR